MEARGAGAVVKESSATSTFGVRDSRSFSPTPTPTPRQDARKHLTTPSTRVNWANRRRQIARVALRIAITVRDEHSELFDRPSGGRVCWR